MATGERPPAPGPRRRIFVVDDDPEVTELLTRLLDENGFEALGINDPRKVHGQALSLRPDLIIVDFDMRKLSGPELAAMLKANPVTRPIPILFLSGMADEDHRLIAKSSGAAGYLDKPVDVARLIQTIEGLLGGA
jgi:CheY-like chemotaxis protein